MILISHRGNTNGPSPDYENRPELVITLLTQKISVEVDLRYYKNNFYLGHDEPQYEISPEFLLENKDLLWVHCKDKEAFNQALKLRKVHCFWHQEDDYTMTNFGYVWAYPGKESVSSLCIGVMPESHWSPEETLKKSFIGICTDYIGQYKSIINNK